MKKLLISLFTLLLCVSLNAVAQTPIKEINITIPVPSGGDKHITKGYSPTFVSTNLSGGKNVLEDDAYNGSFIFYDLNIKGEKTVLGNATFDAGCEYIAHGSIRNKSSNLYNHKKTKEGNVVDATTLKITINGQPAKICKGSHPRSVVFDFVVKIPGEKSQAAANTSVSKGEGRHNGFEYVDLGLPSGLKWATCNIGPKLRRDMATSLRMEK